MSIDANRQVFYVVIGGFDTHDNQTTAVDQFGATLARWMDVADAELPMLFPNIDNFADGPFANATATPSFAAFDRLIPGLMAGI